MVPKNHPFPVSFISKNRKGFTILGVLAASVIGLVVIAGLSQMFANMQFQMKGIENQVNQIFFNERIGNILKTSCERTLAPHISKITTGNSNNPIPFTKILNENGGTAVDLDAESDRLEADYGIKGDAARFHLTCKETTCNCVNKTWGCSKKWALQLTSFSYRRGYPIYNKGMTFEFEVAIKSNNGTGNMTGSIPTPPPTLTAAQKSPNNLDCGNFQIGSSSSPSTLTGSCVNIDSSKNQVFIGCGSTSKNTVTTTTALGYNAGSSKSTGQYNTFLGYETGQENTTAERNIFIGYQVGYKNKTGGNNTFLGTHAGYSNLSGKDNTFAGYQAGYDNTGNYNTFLGTSTGKSNTTGNNNTFLGYKSGYGNTTGSGNVFLGYQAGRTKTTDSNKFIVGNSTDENWLEGTINTTTLKLKGRHLALCSGSTSCTAATASHTHSSTTSSRVYKKNIKPFSNFKKALEDILKTPLFTYQYKEKDQHPKKQRMGIIAEDLPKHLQLKNKDEPTQPDWPSVYGHLWAGIKALHALFLEFKTDILSKLKVMLLSVEALKQNQESLTKEISKIKASLEDSLSQLSTTKKELEETRKKLKALENMQAELTATKNHLSQTDKKLKVLENTQAELTATKNHLSQTDKKLKALENTQAELTATKDHLSQTNKKLKALENTQAELTATKDHLSQTDKKLKALENTQAELTATKNHLSQTNKKLKALERNLETLKTKDRQKKIKQ